MHHSYFHVLGTAELETPVDTNGLGGNLDGRLSRPALDLLEEEKDWYLLEISSFQLETTERLAPLVPADHLLVGESGLHAPADLERLSRTGVNAFLVGESLMRQADVEAATKALLAGQSAETMARA